MAKKKDMPIEECVNDTLPCELVAADAEITNEQYKQLCECKDNALRLAEEIQNNLRTQLSEQVEMYNRDVKYLTEINKNSIKYTRAKEDAVLKILEGVTSLLTIDRMPITPVAEKEEK